MDGSHLPLEVGDIVDRYDHELPALLSHFVEQIDIIALARDIVEVEFLVFEFWHGLTRRLRRFDAEHRHPIETDIRI
jgi:hypothetical protein